MTCLEGFFGYDWAKLSKQLQKHFELANYANLLMLFFQFQNSVINSTIPASEQYGK